MLIHNGLSALCLGLSVALTSMADATGQGPVPAQGGASSASPTAKVDVAVLKGTWVRPDGGYMIVIKSIGANGQLEAMYFNPNPLPFAKARALPMARDGFSAW